MGKKREMADQQLSLAGLTPLRESDLVSLYAIQPGEGK